ncbi:MAG TPA: AAA family ATPase [Gaiellaceae bacterium]|nr:AAA family ATPase [Gaiellaceae bacterium]
MSRTGLVNRLRAERAPVVSVAAPAGYGKTTLLAQWAARDPREFAWLRLGRGDGDSETLLRLLVDAVEGVLPVDAAVRDAAARDNPRAGLVARRLGRQLRSRGTPLVIVLDNIEELDDDCADATLTALCDHLPPGARLVLSGRRAGFPAVARLRAEGRIAELTAGDLRLTDREAALLLRSEGVELDPAAARELNRRAEGWAAGLSLTALAGGPIGGAHHFLAEYFDAEVLDRLPPAAAELALGASVLDALTGPLCDAVLETRGSAAALHRLAAAESFVVPLDRERTTFRLHGLFREALRARLERDQPERFAELSRRASAWCEQAGDLPAAIGHLRAIGDRDGAARLLGAAAPEIWGRGLLTELEPCLDDLRDAPLQMGEHHAAAVAGTLAHALLGHDAEALRWASVADAGPQSGAARAVRAALCEDGIEHMRDDAAAAVADERAPVHAFALLVLGVARLLGGDVDSARRTLQDAAEAAVPDGAPVVRSLALAELSLIAQDRAEWAAAESLALEARELVRHLVPDDHPACALACVASARSALRQSNWARAGDDIETAHRLLPRLGAALPWLAVQSRLGLARVHLALNDSGAAAELLADVDRLLVRRPQLGTLRAATEQLHERVDRRRGDATAPGSLTAAELRLLPLLTTHLTFRQIADHLFVSRNTIKTQAISVYRKLGASSRTEAIDRAAELGLLQPSS